MQPTLDENDKEVSLTFAKGLAVIRAFDGKERSISMTEIAERAGLNRAVTRRLVRTLEQLGYISFDRGRYELTPRVLGLAKGFLEGRGIPQIVQPTLRKASDEIGESVSFSMLDGNETVYIAHSFAPARFTLNMVTVGSRVPLLPTAVGRAILAYLDEEQQNEIIRGSQLSPHTDKTETDPEKLLAILADIKAKGYSYAESEYVKGVSSLAAPVLGASAKVTGAVSIIFPEGRYALDEIIQRLVPVLERCAGDISLTF